MQYLNLKGVTNYPKAREGLPEALSKCPDLEELNIGSCYLGYERTDQEWVKKLIGAIGKLEKLKKLDLSNNELGNLSCKIPDQRSKLIEKIEPHETIKTLLNMLCALPALESVDLSNNDQLAVPAETFNTLKSKVKILKLKGTTIYHPTTSNEHSPPEDTTPSPTHLNENQPTKSSCGLF